MNTPAADGLNDLLAAAGFLCLGDCAVHPADGLPNPSGQDARQLVLIGSTGPSLWSVFSQSPEFCDGAPHPLDRYTKRVLTQIATTIGAIAVFPFEGPPYHPFQRWATRCGEFSRSPMGVLTHATYGPWAGFRAAFVTGRTRDYDTAATTPGPCETCTDKPCISACPANALSEETGYDVPRCRSHLDADRTAGCWSGCRARHACPVGQSHAQTPENGRFHMTSFIAL